MTENRRIKLARGLEADLCDFSRVGACPVPGLCLSPTLHLRMFQMSSKGKVTIAAGAVVCNECELKGEVG